MKKLGITLLAAAFSLPLTFAATQDAQSAPPAGQGQTDTSKPAKKKTAKKKNTKKDKGTATTAEPTTK
jgi:hypothetical protein